MAHIGIDTDRFDEVRRAVGDGLTRYNDGFLPKPRDRHPFAISVRDEAGAVIGGLVGEWRMNWLYVDLLWVDERQRGKGYGAKLLAEAEQEMRRIGVTHMFLSTWSFQAPDFYRAQGFEEFGRLVDHPAGIDSIYFVKRL